MNERLASYFALTKPGVVILLQITGICSVIAHDLLEAGGLSGSTARTIAVVLVGGTSLLEVQIQSICGMTEI